MLRKLLFCLALSALLLVASPAVFAGEAGFTPKEEFSIGKVIKILEEGEEGGIPYQDVLIKSRGQENKIRNGGDFVLRGGMELRAGDKVVLVRSGDEYMIMDKYRLLPMLVILALFFFLVIAFSGRKGAASIAGLGISILILIKFVAPEIIAGSNPLFIGILGSFAIAFLSIYAAHGINKRTSIALLSTFITLAIASVAAILFVKFSHLFGTGSEEALFLQTGGFEDLNLQGLLLAGIIIGTLGVLDDITTSQTAAVEEISRAGNGLNFSELWKRGVSVGKEHISSLVNTLVLAYAGASLPLFLLFTLNRTEPLWVIFNNEMIAEEVIRTLVGSASLVLAVPISTFLAAYFFSKQKPR